MSGQHSEPIIDESTRTYLRSKLPEYLRAHGIDPERSFTCLNPNHSDFEQVMRYNPRTQTVDCPQCHASFDIFDLVSLEYSLPDTESAVHYLYQQYYGAAQPAQSPQSAQSPQPPQQPQPAPAAPSGRTLDLDLDNINSLSDDFFAGVKPVDHVPDQNFPGSTEPDLDLSLPLERPQRVEPQFGPIMDVVIDARDRQPFVRPMTHAGANGGAPSGQPQGGGFPPFAPIKATKEPAHAEFELPVGSKKAPLGDVRVMGPLTGSPVGAQGGASVGTSVGTVSGTVGLPLGAPQHTEPLPRMMGNAPRRADPFSDPEFLKAQKIKPTFVEPVPSQPHEPPRYVSPGSEEEERPSKLNPPNVRDLDHIQLNPEEIARRTAEIWGSPEPKAEATAAPEVPKAYTIPKDSPYVGAGVQAKALDPERRKAQENDARPEVEMPLRNPGAPSTLINGKAFDFDKKSVAEVQSGIRDVMRRNPPVPQREDNPAEVHTAISLSNPLREGPSTLIQRSTTSQAAPQGDNPYAKAFAALNATNDNATRISGYSSALHGNQHQPAPTVSTMISAEPVTPSATTPKTSIFSASTTGLDTNRHTSTLMSDNRGRILTDDFGHRVHEDELNQTKVTAARTATIDFLNPPKDEAKAAPDVILSATASAPAAASTAVAAAATAAPAPDPVDQDVAALSQAATAIFSAITGIEPEGKAAPATPAAPAAAPSAAAQPAVTAPAAAAAPTVAVSPAPAAPEQPLVKKAKPEFFAAEEPETKILEVNPLEERPHDSTPELAPLAGDLDLPDIAKLDGVSPIDDDELGLLDSKLNPLARTVHKDPGFTLSEEEPETNGPQDAFSTLTATANALHLQSQSAPLSAPQPSAPAAAPVAPAPVAPAQITPVAPTPLSPVPPVQAPQATPMAQVVPQVTAPQTPRAAPVPQAQVTPVPQAQIAPTAQPQVSAVAPSPVAASPVAAVSDLSTPAALPSQVRGTLSHYLQRCKDAVGACAYFTAQGLSPAIIERYCLGFDPAYRVEPNFNANTGFEPWQVPMWQAAIIPLNEDSYVAYDMNSPDLMHPDKRYVGQERCFNLNVLSDELTGPLVVCASELDALALLSLNVQTVALGATQHAGLLLEALLESDLSSCALYLCLSQEPGWNEVRDYLLRELSSRGIAVRALDLSYPYGSIIQAFSQDLPSLTSKITQLNSIGDVTLQAAVTPQTLTPNHLVLNLETLARLELSPMMYAISSPAVALSRLVLASLIENKHNAILYAGSKMQWQMICSLLTFNQSQYGALPGALGLSMAGYQARFLELPLEQSAVMLEATLNHGLVAARLSGMAPTLMVDTFAFDHSMCAQLSPRLAQLASEFQVPVVVWCSFEQQSIFEGNALQTLAINQGNDNELIFTTLDSSCRLHSFSTKQG